MYIVPCTLLAKFDVVILALASLPWHANLANKLSKHRGFCTIVLHLSGNTVIVVNYGCAHAQSMMQES